MYFRAQCVFSFCCFWTLLTSGYHSSNDKAKNLAWVPKDVLWCTSGFSNNLPSVMWARTELQIKSNSALHYWHMTGKPKGKKMCAVGTARRCNPAATKMLRQKKTTLLHNASGVLSADSCLTNFSPFFFCTHYCFWWRINPWLCNIEIAYQKALLLLYYVRKNRESPHMNTGLVVLSFEVTLWRGEIYVSLLY